MLNHRNGKVRIKVIEDNVKLLLYADEIQSDMDRKAQKILARQKATCPVDTGNMKAHLQIKETPDGKGRQVGVFDTPPLPDADYVLYVVNGHDTRSGSHVPAQPFIQQSMDAARE